MNSISENGHSPLSAVRATGRRLEGTHRPLSSSFWGSYFRILQGNPKKELLRCLGVR